MNLQGACNYTIRGPIRVSALVVIQYTARHDTLQCESGLRQVKHDNLMPFFLKEYSHLVK